tara:strand:+ start:781 stop:1941 length:1161 start_codon:yes stop_codon:yes gene_type:complete
MPRIKKLVVDKLFSDEEIAKREGKWYNEDELKYPVITSNIDVYYKDDDGSEKLLLKFRKNKLSETSVEMGWKSYKDLAKASRGRGASAGPIDTKGTYWKKRNIVNTNKWSTGYLTPKGNELKKEFDLLEIGDLQEMVKKSDIKYSEEDFKDKETLVFLLIKKEGGVSKMKVNNQVASNPIGFYEASNNFSKLPCRLTHFTRTNFEKYHEGLSFIQEINNQFKKLVPESYKKQLERANTKPHLKIPKTCFSTITINRNFRTAQHKDAGDFSDGFGNLSIIKRGKYHGGYTAFPQFGVAVDVDTGDFLAMDVHQWHCNTEIIETPEDKEFNDKMDSDYHDNPEVGTVGIYEKYTRLTFVCYLREKIANCPDSVDPRFLTKSGHGKIEA